MQILNPHRRCRSLDRQSSESLHRDGLGSKAIAEMARLWASRKRNSCRSSKSDCQNLYSGLQQQAPMDPFAVDHPCRILLTDACSVLPV
jgi:hypothetical protein